MANNLQTELYGVHCAELIEREDTCELGPGSPNTSLRTRLQSLTDAMLFGGHHVVDRDMAACCRSALWLRHDLLDESHRISQDVDTTTGSYWHGIMHRREPDYSNAKYWFRRVGKHDIFPALGTAARDLAVESKATGAAKFLIEQASWDQFRFTDLCEAAARHAAAEQLCRLVADAEWRLLFDYSYCASIGRDTANSSDS